MPLADDGSFHSRVVKYFYVSPFSDLDLEFDFRFHLPDERLRVFIDDYSGADRELGSILTGKRVPLTDANLLRFSFKYPLLTLQVIVGIHWHALLLWLKGNRPDAKRLTPNCSRESTAPINHSPITPLPAPTRRLRIPKTPTTHTHEHL